MAAYDLHWLAMHVEERTGKAVSPEFLLGVLEELNSLGSIGEVRGLTHDDGFSGGESNSHVRAVIAHVRGLGQQAMVPSAPFTDEEIAELPLVELDEFLDSIGETDLDETS